MRVAIVFFVCLFLAIPSQAKVIYVDAHANGTGNGSSWMNAYKFLQDALAEADSATKPVEIRVADGIYTPDRRLADPNDSGNRKATFQLLNGVAIYGGYAGFGEPDPDARNINEKTTTLSGDIGALAFKDDNSYHVVTGSGTDATAVLDGFTITAGYAKASGYTNPDGWGGGMYTDSGNPAVANCTFSTNSAVRGGGMYNSNSNTTVVNCSFSDNSAALGGGMYNKDGTPAVVNCSFKTNFAADGGGMYNNSVDAFAFAVHICTFINNIADSDGGGAYNTSSEPRFTCCVFMGNAAAEGGAIWNYYGRTIIYNCTISGNSAKRGGAIYSMSKPVTVKNSILWANTDDEIYLNNTTAPVSYSNVQGGWSGVRNIDADPCFAKPGYLISVDEPIVDDMESYCPGSSSCAINRTWLDWQYGDDTGAEVWLAEKSQGYPVHAGDQSLEFSYDNDNPFGSPKYSEIRREFDDARNWIVPGLRALKLYFYGDSNNDANPTEQMYMALEDSLGNVGVVRYGAPNNVRIDKWQEWTIGLQEFEDVNLGSIQKLIIGFGNRDEPAPGGKGTVYFDDIELFAEPNPFWIEGDYHLLPGSPCIDTGYNPYVPADMADIDGDGNRFEQVPWDLDRRPRMLNGDCTGTRVVDMGAYELLRSDIDSNGSVDLKDLSRFASYWMDTGCAECGGADLTCDGNVDHNDLQELVEYWLTGQ